MKAPCGYCKMSKPLLPHLHYLGRDPKERQLYIIGAYDNNIKHAKIGISKDPECRFKELQRNSPIKLILYWTSNKTPILRSLNPALIERDIKRRLQKYRAHENSYEWFNIWASSLSHYVKDYMFEIRKAALNEIGDSVQDRHNFRHVKGLYCNTGLCSFTAKERKHKELIDKKYEWTNHWNTFFKEISERDKNDLRKEWERRRWPDGVRWGATNEPDSNYEWATGKSRYRYGQ